MSVMAWGVPLIRTGGCADVLIFRMTSDAALAWRVRYPVFSLLGCRTFQDAEYAELEICNVGPGY